MDIYKTILNSIVEPLCNDNYDFDLILEYANQLKGSEGNSDNISNAVGETILRVNNYIGLSLQILKEWRTK